MDGKQPLAAGYLILTSFMQLTRHFPGGKQQCRPGIPSPRLTPSFGCFHASFPHTEIGYLLYRVCFRLSGCDSKQTSTSHVLSTQPPFMDSPLINHSKGPTKCHENKAVVQGRLRGGGDILMDSIRTL